MTSPDQNPTPNDIRFVSESQPNSVYKYFDAHGILIYVGVTKTGVTRNRQHNLDKSWWAFVDHQTVEHCESRDRALAREAELVNQFRPPFNTKHNPDHADIRQAYVTLQMSGQLGLNARQLLAKGDKRLLKLLPVSQREDDYHVFFHLSGHFVDRPLWACVRSVSTNAPVLNRHGQRLGTVTDMASGDGWSGIVIGLRKEQFSYPPRILRASAKMRYPQLKPFVVAEVRNVIVEFLIRGG